MATSDNELEDLILHNEHRFTLEIAQPDGSSRAYDGRGIASFAQNQRKRNHPFRITDGNGQLVFSRDGHGTVTIGNAEELLLDMRREKMIRAQMLVDHTRNAIRLRFQALRASQ